MDHIALDDYVVDVLMPDLTRHDRCPNAFLVYVVIWTALFRLEERSVPLSLAELSQRSGLSKSGVQTAIRLLKRRGLINVLKVGPTAVPKYELVRHWVRRRARK